MIFNNIQYNGFLLNDICHIEDIRLPILPSKKISTVNSPIDGIKINTSKYYNEYSIEIDMIIDCDTEEELKDRIKTLRNVFDVEEVKPLIINNDRFILCIPDEGIEKELIAFNIYSSTVKLLCPEPYFYSTEIDLFEDENKQVTIKNNSNKESDKGVIQIYFNDDAHFIQLKHDKTNSDFLVGEYPTRGNTDTSNSNVVVEDECKNLTKWTLAAGTVGSDRSSTGTFAITDSGEGIKLGTTGDGSTSWKGACARLNLNQSIDEFELECRMHHNSYGINGDPTLFNADKETVGGTVTSGSKTTYYEVTCPSLNIRSGPATSYKKVGTLKKGAKITNGTIEKGWVKWSKDGKTVYCSKEYLKEKFNDSTTVTTTSKTIQNVMVYNTTGSSTGTWLYELADPYSKKLCTLSTGSVVRIVSSEKYKYTEGDKWWEFYKLYTKYNGFIGYVNTANVLFSGNIGSVSWDVDSAIDTADDKTGTIELRGYSENNEEIFCISLIDDNAYYEYTRPYATIGSEVALVTSKAPQPKQDTTTQNQDNKQDVTVTNKLSGKYEDWNDFYGQWNISRKKINDEYIWNIEVKKIKDGAIVKTQKCVNIKSSKYPTSNLSYVKLYEGTTQTLDKTSAMSLGYLKIKKLNNTVEENKNIIHFKANDILEIDLENHKCYLNDIECNNIVDIGSRYFKLPTGESTIKCSTDANIFLTVLFRRKYLGEF